MQEKREILLNVFDTSDFFRVPEVFTQKQAAITAVRGVLDNHDTWECLNEVKAKMKEQQDMRKKVK